MKYYVLLVKDDAGRWCVEFGSYDKDDVKAEWQDQRDHGVARSRLAMVVTEPNEASIEAAVLRRNACE